jgi:hypothetical protein
MDAMQVLWDQSTEQYVMLYQGYNLQPSQWGLGIATSSDGHSWARLPTNPVVDLTVPVGDVRGYCWPLGLTVGEVAGFTGYIAGYSKNNGPCEVYRINAPNISSWTPDTAVVLPAGELGSWDAQGAVSLAIAELDGIRYMFYVGFGDWEAYDGYRITKNQFLGWATWDGASWQKMGDPIPLHTNEEGFVNSVAAVTVGSRIHLWVTDDYSGIQAVGYFLFDPNREEAQ